MSDIAARLADVNKRINDAAERAHRDPADVTLIAVSKTWPWEFVSEAARCGQIHFGENKVQEALSKIEHANTQPDIVWHLIGHLQSNKAKLVPGHFGWLHTLDSIKLANRLESYCEELDCSLNVLLQVNVADDPAKYGLAKSSLHSFLDDYLQTGFKRLQLRGLMTIGAVESSEIARRGWFAELRKMQEHIASKYELDDFDQLSMGMSGDFEEAVEEGATFVRVGSTIFGNRN